MRRERTIKCVVVGDSGVGKTHMLLTLQRGEPPAKGETLPVMCEIHTTNVEWRPQYLPTVDRGDSSDADDSRSRSPAPQKIALQVFDTCAREKHARLRPLTYFDVDVYIVAFSVADPASMEHVASLWLPELQKLGRKRMKGGARETLCPVVLVGLRTESRENSLFGEATEQAGRAFAEKLGIQGYTEVAPDGDVTDVFQAVVETYMKNLKVESCARTCVVM